MGSQKSGIVGKSQPVLLMINPIIFTRTRTTFNTGWPVPVHVTLLSHRLPHSPSRSPARARSRRRPLRSPPHAARSARDPRQPRRRRRCMPPSWAPLRPWRRQPPPLMRPHPRQTQRRRCAIGSQGGRPVTRGWMGDRQIHWLSCVSQPSSEPASRGNDGSAAERWLGWAGLAGWLMYGWRSWDRKTVES
jgi:hypothetical protein